MKFNLNLEIDLSKLDAEKIQEKAVEAVQNCIESQVQKHFSSYSDFAEAIQKQLKDANFGSYGLDTNKLGAMINNTIDAKLNAAVEALVSNKNIDDEIGQVLFRHPITPKEFFYELMKAFHEEFDFDDVDEMEFTSVEVSRGLTSTGIDVFIAVPDMDFGVKLQFGTVSGGADYFMYNTDKFCGTFAKSDWDNKYFIDKPVNGFGKNKVHDVIASFLAQGGRFLDVPSWERDCEDVLYNIVHAEEDYE